MPARWCTEVKRISNNCAFRPTVPVPGLTDIAVFHLWMHQFLSEKRKMPNRNEKPFVFVFMPFSEDFKDVYELGIKAACASVGAECARVDEQIFLESILERIYKQIEIADLIIAEMSDRNANVFYETGYAHGLGKRVILLTRESGDIPFGGVAGLVGIEGGVVSGVFNLESSGVEAPDWRPRHDERYHKA